MNTLTGPLTSIDWGSSLSGRTISYAFASNGTRTNSDETAALGESYTAERMKSYEKAQFRAALELISNVTKLTFVEGSYGSADLRFMADRNQMDSDDLGVMLTPDGAGAGLGVFNGSAWDDSPGGNLEQGGSGFVTIVHELLHGLGLAHPHDTGGHPPS